MQRTTPSRFGFLGILLLGVVIGYVIASTNTSSFSSADAREADITAGPAKAPPRVSPVKARPRDVYFPNTEDLNPDEMRVIRLHPFSQAGFDAFYAKGWNTQSASKPLSRSLRCETTVLSNLIIAQSLIQARETLRGLPPSTNRFRI